MTISAMTDTAFNPKKNPCKAGAKCGWDGHSVGCTQPGCYGPAIFRMKEASRRESGFRGVAPTSVNHAMVLEDLARRIDDE